MLVHKIAERFSQAVRRYVAGHAEVIGRFLDDLPSALAGEVEHELLRIQGAGFLVVLREEFANPGQGFYRAGAARFTFDDRDPLPDLPPLGEDIAPAEGKGIADAETKPCTDRDQSRMLYAPFTRQVVGHVRRFLHADDLRRLRPLPHPIPLYLSVAIGLSLDYSSSATVGDKILQFL